MFECLKKVNERVDSLFPTDDFTGSGPGGSQETMSYKRSQYGETGISAVVGDVRL